MLYPEKKWIRKRLGTCENSFYSFLQPIRYGEKRRFGARIVVETPRNLRNLPPIIPYRTHTLGGRRGTPPRHSPPPPNNPAATVHIGKKRAKRWVFEVIMHGKERGWVRY